jgi:hypothetical protein
MVPDGGAMFQQTGIAELVIICVTGLLSIGLPVAILVFLYLIYSKLKSIEDLLKKKQD